MSQAQTASQFATILNGANAEYIANLYREFLKNPNGVDASWRNFFNDLRDDEKAILGEIAGASWGAKEHKKPSAPFGFVPAEDVVKGTKPANQSAAAAKPSSGVDEAQLKASLQALLLVRAYRDFGHLMADIDPLGFKVPQLRPELDIATYGLEAGQTVNLSGLMGFNAVKVADLLAALQRTYCGAIGFEYTYMLDKAERDWVENKITNRAAFSAADKKRLYELVVKGEGFEQFLATKFVGVKRFGVDGGESYIALMEECIRKAAQLGCVEVVIGMAHRGRLNTLTNICGKPYMNLLSEFMGVPSIPEGTPGSGDVKYHLGYSSDKDYEGNQVHVTLTPNPSHLEVVNPVAMGKTRAKQDLRGDTEKRNKVMALLVHGDAAFAGQGVVPESLAMQSLKGYRIGGTVHVIINNQVGFTTRPECARSGPYSSDMAKMLMCPILHVNGDDVEAVAFAGQFAAEYRAQFGKDVVIDLMCYRRYGHNEGDEPAFTQPIMYKKIKTMQTVSNKYAAQLAGEGVLSADAAKASMATFLDTMEKAYEAAKGFKPNKADAYEGAWTGLSAAPNTEEAYNTATGIDVKTLQQVGEKLVATPAGFNLNGKIARQFEQKKEMFNKGEGIDWATGEALAFATLLEEGFNIRLSGEDVGRGTFSHRHAMLIDQETDKPYYPLQNLGEKQGRFEAYESHLSEFAVLGYDYGYSWGDPNTLVCWEGQFGDFVNGAQVVIDQYIASAETKWLRASGLVLLLPHGFEGQGPEHSSARPERFLQLCAEDNMQVTNITTPANYFHALRRQLKRSFRKPLINMSPKSLLRHKLATSSLAEFDVNTGFKAVLPDAIQNVKGKEMRKVVICSGKVYYDLYEEREKRGVKDVAILRLEQFYPFPAKALAAELEKYPNAEIVWSQEEPKNQGAWFFVEPFVEEVLKGVRTKSSRMKYTGRAAAAAPATGYMKRHTEEQQKLVADALV